MDKDHIAVRRTLCSPCKNKVYTAIPGSRFQYSLWRCVLTVSEEDPDTLKVPFKVHMNQALA